MERSSDNRFAISRRWTEPADRQQLKQRKHGICNSYNAVACLDAEQIRAKRISNRGFEAKTANTNLNPHSETRNPQRPPRLARQVH
jgi:hypothetical protein